MAITLHGFTWNIGESDYGLHSSTDGRGNLALRDYLPESVHDNYLDSSYYGQGWGSAFLFFYFDYKVIGDNLKITLKEAYATNEQRNHTNWSATGIIKANGVEIFNGTLSSSNSSLISRKTKCPLTINNQATTNLIPYTKDDNWLTTINFTSTFSQLTCTIEMVYPAGTTDGWIDRQMPHSASSTTTHRYNIITFRSNWWGENLSSGTNIYNVNNLTSKPVRLAIVKNNNEDGKPITQTYWGKNSAVNSINYHATLFADDYQEGNSTYNVCAQIHGWTLDIPEKGYYNVHLFPGFTGGGSRWAAHTTNNTNQVAMWYLGEKLNYGNYGIAWISNKEGTIISDEVWGSTQRAWVGSFPQNSYGAETNWGVVYSFGKEEATLPKGSIFIQDSNISGAFNRYTSLIYNEITNTFESCIPYIYKDGSFQIIA